MFSTGCSDSSTPKDRLTHTIPFYDIGIVTVRLLALNTDIHVAVYYVLYTTSAQVTFKFRIGLLLCLPIYRINL